MIRQAVSQSRSINLTILFFLLTLPLFAEDSGSMKDFIRKGHLLNEVDLNYCTIDTLTKLYRPIRQVSEAPSNLPNSPKGSTIAEYEFETFYVGFYFSEDKSILTSERNKSSLVLFIKAKQGVKYAEGISIGMSLQDIQKKLGSFEQKEGYSYHVLDGYFTLHISTDSDHRLTELLWQREMGD